MKRAHVVAVSVALTVAAAPAAQAAESAQPGNPVAETAVSQAQQKISGATKLDVTPAGDTADIHGDGFRAEATAYPLSGPEDGAGDPVVDTDIQVTEGEFELSPEQLSIADGDGHELARAAKASVRDADTNQYLRELDKGTTVKAGESISVQFTFDKDDQLDDTDNVMGLNDADRHALALWNLR